MQFENRKQLSNTIFFHYVTDFEKILRYNHRIESIDMNTQCELPRNIPRLPTKMLYYASLKNRLHKACIYGLQRQQS